MNSDQAIRAIYVAGTLTFARDKTTRLDVGLIKVQPGEEYSEEGFDCDGHFGKPGFSWEQTDMSAKLARAAGRGAFSDVETRKIRATVAN